MLAFVADLQSRQSGAGRVRPQVREPAVTKDQQKDMMAFYYKKQEEFKVAAAHYN
jgi:hypothetical protein